MTKRKTGKDYRKELSELNSKERILKAAVNQRLLELTKAYPDIDLPTSRAGGLKCKDIAHPWIIQETNIDAVIEYIEAIEQHLANVHPHKQTAIKF
jgi:hypothetical protein